MNLRELERALASGDEHAMRSAIGASAARLRESGADDAPLVAALARLSAHASAHVRLAAVNACDALPEAVFEEVHARALADDDPYVQRAAEAAGHRRAQRRKKVAHANAQAEATRRLLDAIEASPGREARRLAQRFADEKVEEFAQQLDHEIRKTRNGMLLALIELEGDVEQIGGAARALLLGRVATTKACAGFVFGIVRRAREFATRVKPVFREESLAAVVEAARVQFEEGNLAPALEHAFAIEIDPALRIDLDEQALRQALLNAFENAVQAYDELSAPRRAIRVVARTRRGGSEVVLTVADDGVGMSPERLAKCFVPFGSKKPGGTGVGLAIMKRMIDEVHGGELTLASAPGKGTTVTIVLPARQRRS
jgi:signal transduction histidine kinase